MSQDPNRSGFWFHGRLDPGADALFAVDEVKVGEATFLSVAWDGIAVWSRPDPQDMLGWADTVRGPEEAERVFRLVVGAYTLLTATAYDVTLEGWIEATDASFDLTVVGFRVARFQLDRWEPSARENVAMRRAVEIAGAVRNRPGFRQALFDIHAAYRDRGDDAFLFAYRAIEDVAREITGAADLQSSDWETFHRQLGADPKAGKLRIDPLNTARRAAAHGDNTDTELATARADRLNRIAIGRRLAAEALASDRAIPFELGDLWT